MVRVCFRRLLCLVVQLIFNVTDHFQEGLLLELPISACIHTAPPTEERFPQRGIIPSCWQSGQEVTQVLAGMKPGEIFILAFKKNQPKVNFVRKRGHFRKHSAEWTGQVCLRNGPMQAQPSHDRLMGRLMNPCWLFLITFLSFVCVEMISRRICSASFPGTRRGWLTHSSPDPPA